MLQIGLHLLPFLPSPRSQLRLSTCSIPSPHCSIPQPWTAWKRQVAWRSRVASQSAWPPAATTWLRGSTSTARCSTPLAACPHPPTPPRQVSGPRSRDGRQSCAMLFLEVGNLKARYRFDHGVDWCFIWRRSHCPPDMGDKYVCNRRASIVLVIGYKYWFRTKGEIIDP